MAGGDWPDWCTIVDAACTIMPVELTTSPSTLSRSLSLAAGVLALELSVSSLPTSCSWALPRQELVGRPRFLLGSYQLALTLCFCGARGAGLE